MALLNLEDSSTPLAWVKQAEQRLRLLTPSPTASSHINSQDAYSNQDYPNPSPIYNTHYHKDSNQGSYPHIHSNHRKNFIEIYSNCYKNPNILISLLHMSKPIGAPSFDLERNAKEKFVLDQIGQTLTSDFDLEQLLETIHRQLTQLFEVDNFYVALLAPQRNEIWYPLAVKNGIRQDWSRTPCSIHRLP